MDPTRRIAITTGALFILATAASVTATAFLPALTGADYLAGVATHANALVVSAFLYLIAAGASVGIAISLYPLLNDTHAALALGSVVFRTIEAVFYTVGVVSLLTIATLGQQPSTPAAEPSPTYAMADSLLSVREHSDVVAVLAFCVGACMYYVVFYRTRLVPRWLSGWGLLAVPAMLVACLLALFSDNPVTGYVFLFLPIAVQEMVLAFWLLAKGFNPSPLPRVPDDRSALPAAPAAQQVTSRRTSS